jgi:hypothetical protein
MSQPQGQSSLDIEFDIASIEDVANTAPVETPEEVNTSAPVAETIETPKAEIPGTPEPAAPVAEVKPLETPSASTDEPSLLSEIVQKLGYEDIDIADYEESPEGLAKMTHEIGTRIAGETLDELFNSMPSLKQHFEFIRNGGDPKAFMETQAEPDYSNMEVTAENAKNVLRDYFKARGDEDAFIDDMIEAYEDKGTLKDKAEQAKNALATVQEKKRTKMLEDQQKAAELQRQESEKVWNTVKDTVKNSSELAGLPVTERDKAKFIEFISAPIDKQGRTQRDIAASKLNLEQQLAMDFLIFKGVDLKKFVDAKAGTKQALSLRDRLKTAPRPSGGKQNPNVSGPASELGDITIDDLI